MDEISLIDITHWKYLFFECTDVWNIFQSITSNSIHSFFLRDSVCSVFSSFFSEKKIGKKHMRSFFLTKWNNYSIFLHIYMNLIFPIPYSNMQYLINTFKDNDNLNATYEEFLEVIFPVVLKSSIFLISMCINDVFRLYFNNKLISVRNNRWCHINK